MLTEEPNPRTENIDQLSTLEILRVINSEDALVAQAVQQALPQIAQAVEVVTGRIESGGRLIYMGAGTSGRLGVLDAAECLPTFGAGPDVVCGIIAGGEWAMIHPVEGAEDDVDGAIEDLRRIQLSAKDAVVGIAASGRTPYVLAAMEFANATGAATIGVSCNAPAPLLDITQIPVAVIVGSEVITGSTRMKAGSAQKMVLNMLSSATMIKLGKVYGNWMVDVQITNAKLVRRARLIVTQITGIDLQEASILLDKAGGEVKTAIVMYVRQVGAEEARAILREANGHLRAVIGNAALDGSRSGDNLT